MQHNEATVVLVWGLSRSQSCCCAWVQDALYKLRMAQSKAAGDDEAKRKAALEHMRQVLTIRRVNLPVSGALAFCWSVLHSQAQDTP